MSYLFAFNEETLREALMVMAVAGVKGALVAQGRGGNVRSYQELLKSAARAINDEGRTPRTEAVFGLADTMIENIKNFERTEIK